MKQSVVGLGSPRRSDWERIFKDPMTTAVGRSAGSSQRDPGVEPVQLSHGGGEEKKDQEKEGRATNREETEKIIGARHKTHLAESSPFSSDNADRIDVSTLFMMVWILRGGSAMTENQKKLWDQLTNLTLYAKSLLGKDYEVDLE